MSRRRKRIVVKAISEFFISEKKVYSEKEYAALKNTPVLLQTIKSVFRSYDAFMDALKDHSSWPLLQTMNVKPASVKATSKTTKAKTTIKKAIKVVKEDYSE